MSDKKTVKKTEQTANAVSEEIKDKKVNLNLKKSKDKVKFYKKPGFRYSMLATVLSIVFIAVIVIVNIFASVLDDRVTAMQLDMTANKDYSLSFENVEYIKQLDKDLSITVALSEENYTNGYYAEILETYYYYTDLSNGKYFDQTVQLLKKYAKINSNIKLQFIDPQTPAFDNYANKYADQYTFGTVIVESSFINSDNQQQSRYKLLQAEDLYEVTSDSSYGSYITGSKVESAVTSALVYVSTEQLDKAAIVTGYGTSDAGYLKTLLENNNYDVTEIDQLSDDGIADDIKLLVFVAPTKDLLPDEVKILDDYLLGSEEYGRNLVYVAASSQPSLANFDGLLDEWGIQLGTGTVYETDASSRSAQDATYMLLTDGGSDYLSEYSSYRYLAASMRPITLKYEQFDAYYTYNLIKSSESTTVMPLGASSSWTPSNDAVKQSYVSMALSLYAGGKNTDGEMLSSSILVLSSADLYNQNYQKSAGYANHDAIMTVINDIVGRTEVSIAIQSKTINTSTFTPTEIQANIIKYIVVIIVPAITLVVGIVIVVKRRRK